MTTFHQSRDFQHDSQDNVERQLWGLREYLAGAGSIMSVRGNGTTDLELPVINFGYSFNLGENANAEVIVLAMGGDVNDKVALPVLPADLQHEWAEGTGGIQHPTDADRRIEFNSTDTHHTDGVHTFGENKELTVTVAGGNVTLTVAGDVTFDVNNLIVNGNVQTTGTLTNNGVDVGSSHRHTDTVGLGAGVTSTPF